MIVNERNSLSDSNRIQKLSIWWTSGRRWRVGGDFLTQSGITVLQAERRRWGSWWLGSEAIGLVEHYSGEFWFFSRFSCPLLRIIVELQKCTFKSCFYVPCGLTVSCFKGKRRKRMREREKERGERRQTDKEKLSSSIICFNSFTGLNRHPKDDGIERWVLIYH